MCHIKDCGPSQGLYLFHSVLGYHYIRTELMTPNLVRPSAHQLLRSTSDDFGPDISFDKPSQIILTVNHGLQEEVAKELGVPVQFQWFWIWAKRLPNTTYLVEKAHLYSGEECNSDDWDSMCDSTSWPISRTTEIEQARQVLWQPPLVDHDLLLIVENPKTAKEAWDILAEIFSYNKRSRSIALKGELRSLKLGYLSIDAYFCKIESIATILASLGLPIRKDDIFIIALDGLPDKYEHVFDIIIYREPFPDLKVVRSMLTTTEKRLKSTGQSTTLDTSSSSLMVLLANSGNNNARRSTGTLEAKYHGVANVVA
nr:hybrid signal transduction histidine kinase M [Tanacetum cinerariifolium]